MPKTVAVPIIKHHPGDDYLYTVDTTTGVAALIGVLGFNFSHGGGLAYDEDNQILYLNSVGTGLYTVDVNTGLATYIGPNGIASIDGLAWIQDAPTTPIPEPTTIALLGIGLAGLAGGAVRRRLKKTKQ